LNHPLEYQSLLKAVLASSQDLTHAAISLVLRINLAFKTPTLTKYSAKILSRCLDTRNMEAALPIIENDINNLGVEFECDVYDFLQYNYTGTRQTK
jgi:hypothetical protein